MKKPIFISLLALWAAVSTAQPSQTLYTVVVEPDKADWIYKVGEEATFKIYVTRNRVPLEGISVECEYGPETMPAIKKQTLDIKNGAATLKVPGMLTPGFQTVRATFRANGKTYSSQANVGYEPHKIKPTQTMPADFEEFWNKAKADAADIPLEPLLTLQPELCTPTLNVYHVRFQNTSRGSYIYGMLCVPKKPGKYPAVLQVPGAGLHRFSGYTSLADHGVITLEIGIHGIPVNLPQQVYSDLANTALKGYAQYNLDDRDRYYFKRVFVGCTRAIDFLYSLTEFDGKNLAVMGGSQGGALAIVTAALDPRVKCFASRHPGMCDLSGFMHGRPGGWPALRNNPNIDLQMETARYYDVVNFARILKVPGFYTWGLNDTACPPTTTFSAYNSVTAEKTLRVFEETAHWHFPEQNAEFENYVLTKLGIH